MLILGVSVPLQALHEGRVPCQDQHIADKDLGILRRDAPPEPGGNRVGWQVVLQAVFDAKGLARIGVVRERAAGMQTRHRGDVTAARFCRKLCVETQGIDDCLDFSRQSDRTSEMGEALV